MKKYKKWIIAGSLAVLAAALCAGLYVRKVQRENKSYSLIYIPKVVDGTNDFWTSLILGTEMAAKEYRADIEIMAPEDENDVEGQNRFLEAAIEKKPDAILFSPSSFTESDSLLKTAKEKGIHIVFVDSYTDQDVQDITVATDNLEAGELLGKFAAGILNPEDQIAIVAHVKGVSTAIEREEGFRKGLGDLAEILWTLFTVIPSLINLMPLLWN